MQHRIFIVLSLFCQLVLHGVHVRRRLFLLILVLLLSTTPIITIAARWFNLLRIKCPPPMAPYLLLPSTGRPNSPPLLLHHHAVTPTPTPTPTPTLVPPPTFKISICSNLPVTLAFTPTTLISWILLTSFNISMVFHICGGCTFILCLLSVAGSCCAFFFFCNLFWCLCWEREMLTLTSKVAETFTFLPLRLTNTCLCCVCEFVSQCCVHSLHDFSTIELKILKACSPTFFLAFLSLSLVRLIV